MEIDQLKIFSGLSSSAKAKVNSQAKFVSYKLGQPLCFRDIIPDKITIILEGEARLLAKENNNILTVAKLSKGTITGLTSLLKAEPSELISAASALKTIEIPDKLVLELYNDEPSFKDLCDNTLFPSEILCLTNQSLTL